MELAGRMALITGAGVGTGRAVALALAGRGCDVVINYSRSHMEAEATAADARALGVRALTAGADVADDAAVRAMVGRAVAEFGRLDMLVNNAAVTAFVRHGDLDGVTDADWNRIVAVNVKGPFQVVRAAAPSLRANRGAIVNVSSVAGLTAIGSSIPYCASKAALNVMTVALARALAPEIRVNAVAPGFIDTRWWQVLPGYEEVKQFAADRSLLKRVCSPDDVAAVVVDLLTAEMVTGQVVVVDGGMAIGQ